MNNSPADSPASADAAATSAAQYRPGKIEYGLFGLDLLLFLLLAVRLARPDFLAGPLLACLAFAFLPGAALTLFGRRAVPTHRAGFAAGLLTYLVLKKVINPDDILAALTNWQYVVPGMLILSLQLFVGAFRWQLLLRGQDIHIHYTTLVRLLFIGSFFNTFIPGSSGSDVYRIYRVSQESHVSTASVATSVVLDRFLGLPAMLGLILLGVLLNLDFVKSHEEFRHMVRGLGIFIGIFAVGVAGLFFGSFFLSDRLERLEDRIPGGRILRRLTGSIAVYRRRPALIFGAMAVSTFAHLAVLFGFLFFAQAVKIQGVAASEYLFLVFAGMTANYLPLAPAGAGQGEAAFHFLFDLASPGLGNGPRAATMMLCFRCGMLLCGLLGGVLYSLGKEHIRFSRDPQDAGAAAAAAAEPAAAGDDAPPAQADPATNQP